MEIIDTHCHLDVEEFDADRSAVIERARAQGVTGFLVPAIHRDGWGFLLELCRSAGDLHAALGMHPIYLARHREAHLPELEETIEREQPVAVGEIGLDFSVRDLDRDRQQRLFEAQLAIARDARLPVVLHVRKSHDPVLASLRRIGVRGGIGARLEVRVSFDLARGKYDPSVHLARLVKSANTLPEESTS